MQCFKREGSDPAFGIFESQTYLKSFVSDFDIRISKFDDCKISRANSHSRSISAGKIRWWERMARSVVQNATRRAVLCATSKRSKGSRVHSSQSACLIRVSNGMSSTINRLSFITLLVKSGFFTESRPTSARNWISRKETGDTPQGRYRSNQGNLVSLFDSRTSQTKKCVSRRIVTAWTAAVARGGAQDANPTTNDLPRRHAALSTVSCIPEWLWHSLRHWAPPVAAQPVVLCARPQSPRLGEPRQEDGTSVFWLQTLSHSSHVQCTRISHRESTNCNVRFPVVQRRERQQFYGFTLPTTVRGKG